MTSSLYITKTPKPAEVESFAFKHPLKGIIARRYYDHDGSLSGETITLTGDDLAWFTGLIDGFMGDGSDLNDLMKIKQLIENGETIDIWIE